MLTLQVIEILNHKTVQKYGAARVCMNPKLYKRFVVFINHVRKRSPGYEEGMKHVFFTTKSTQVSSSSFNYSMKETCKTLDKRNLATHLSTKNVMGRMGNDCLVLQETL